MDITLKDPVAPSVEARLGENDKIVFRCYECQEFSLPAELTIWKPTKPEVRRNYPWLIKFSCPKCGCFDLMELSREKFLMTMEAERAGLVLVDTPGLIQVAN
jgi:hypothetical protein